MGSYVPRPYMVNTNKYFVNSEWRWDDIHFLILRVQKVVLGYMLSKSDEMVKAYKSCEDFSACLS